MTRAWLALAVFAFGCAAVPKCPATPDLDAQYWDAVIVGCPDDGAPLTECPAAQRAAEEYEAAVAARCSKP